MSTLKERLSLCDYMTRSLFRDLTPLMRESPLYGWLEEPVDGLARRFSVSPAWLYRSLAELRQHGILRQGKMGHYSPDILSELVIRVRKCKR